MAVSVLFIASYRGTKHTPRNETKQTDELLAVILPTINHER